MIQKRSQYELKRLLQNAFAEACDLPRPGLWFCIDKVVGHGKPINRIDVWATLHFTEEGSPFCCPEVGCQLGLSSERLDEIGDFMRRAMGLRQEVTIDIGNMMERVEVVEHPGVTFTVCK